jgi:hypothetical protein
LNEPNLQWPESNCNGLPCRHSDTELSLRKGFTGSDR